MRLVVCFLVMFAFATAKAQSENYFSSTQLFCETSSNGGSQMKILNHDTRRVYQVEGGFWGEGYYGECRNAVIDSSPLTRSSSMICLSKDNTGEAPYVVNIYDHLSGRSTALVHLQMDTFEGCLELKRHVRHYRQSLTYCGSRDANGQAPFVDFVRDGLQLDVEPQIIHPDREFSDIYSCFADLKSF